MPTRSEVSEHSSRQSCWVIIRDIAYDLTDFIDSHPGGARIVLKYAGKDATEAFEPVHPSDVLEKYLKLEQNLGPVTGSPILIHQHVPSPRNKSAGTRTSPTSKPLLLSSIINIRDFEIAASQRLSAKSFAFFKTGAEDEFTIQRNRNSWKAIRFRPRVLRPIKIIDISTTLFNTKFSAPFFICPAGGGKLAHPTGETLLAKAAGRHDVLHWVCNNAGSSQQEITDARKPGQTAFWQIYAMRDLAITEKEIRQAIAHGYKGFALTVDTIRSGKRERDMRSSVDLVEDADYSEAEDESFSRGPSVKRSQVYSEFDWIFAIRWLRGLTDLPIAIKGIQCWEDAKLCMQHGVHPWLSNHGGRQLDGAPSAAETLLEIRQQCPEVFEKCEVIVDGGITRGTDIIKALALGATGVGLGRAFLYSLVFGEVGVSKAIRILKHEVETAMALLGVTSIDQLTPSHVDTSGLVYALAISRPRL